MVRFIEQKTKKIMIFAGTLAFAVVQPGMLVYAGPAADTINVEQTAQTIVTYGQSQVATLGTWEQQTDSTWRFKAFTGEYLTSAWLESQSEAGCWYFVDSNGIMLVSVTTPDGFYVNQNGEWRATTSSHSNTQQTASNQQATQQTSTSNTYQDSNTQGDLSWEEFSKLSKEEKRAYKKQKFGIEVVDLTGATVDMEAAQGIAEMMDRAMNR